MSMSVILCTMYNSTHVHIMILEPFTLPLIKVPVIKYGHPLIKVFTLAPVVKG